MTAAPPASAERGDAPKMVRLAAALFSAQVTSWMITALGLLVVPRYLGARDFGILATGSTLAAFMLALASLGTLNYVIKSVARAPEESRRILVSVVILRLTAWALMMAVAVPAIFLFVEDRFVRGVLVLLAAQVSLDLVKTATTAGLQAHYALARTAIVQSLVGLAAQLVIVTALIAGHGLLAIVAVLFASAVLQALITAGVYWGKFGGRVRVSTATLTTVLAGSVTYLAWDAALMVFNSVDVLMLAALSGATASGIYAFALRLTAVPTFVHVILGGAIFPSLSAAATSDPAHVRTVLARSVHILVVTTLPMAAGIMLLAPDLTTLIGGEQYAAATVVVFVLAPVIPLIGLDTVLGTTLFAVDRQRAWTMVAWSAAVANPSLNLIAIPLAASFWGNAAIGAALTTAATEVMMTVFAWRLLGSYADRRAAGAVAARTLLACGAMAVPVLLVRDFVGAIPAIPVGAAVYAASALGLGLVSPSDLRFVHGALRGGRRATAPASATSPGD